MAWGTGSLLVEQRTNPSGNPLGANVLLEEDAASSHSMDIARGAVLNSLVWVDEQDGNAEIYGAFIGADGSVSVPPFRFTTTSTPSLDPAVAHDGTDFGVVWTDDSGGHDEVYMTLMDTGGAFSTPAVVTSATVGASSPDIDHGDPGFGIVWVEEGSGGNTTIRFTIVDGTGEPLVSAIDVSGGTSAAVAPSLVWSPDGWGVVWHDDADGDDEIYFAIIETVTCS
jgi:hypothetical protein